MTQDHTDEDDLVFTIQFALGALNVPSKLSKTETRAARELRRQLLAKKIVEQIKLSNWKFQRGPLLQGHSTHDNTNDDGN